MSCGLPPRRLFLGFRFGPADAGEVKKPAGVVELFTSQGCSSCPPADAILGELAKKGDVDRARLSRRLLGLSRLAGHAGHAGQYRAPV